MSQRPEPATRLPWALSALGETSGAVLPTLTAVSEDASARRYFRFHQGGQNHVLVDAPPTTEKNREFLAVRALLAQQGIRVPALRAADLEQGYLLLEDLGDRLLLSELSGRSADRYYGQAFGLLLQMAAIDTRGAGLKCYDRALLEEELSRFQRWFVVGLLDHALTDSEEDLLKAVSELLVTGALAQPHALVHRDFHSRNLMLVDRDDMAIIDFQDAVIGPVTYDLVSLLRDCYIYWPPARVRQWALNYHGLLQSRSLLQGVDRDEFLRWFDWMGLQRHMKVLGNFARLHLRDGKSGYLGDLPLVLRYVQEVLGYYKSEPVLADLGDWFGVCLSPLIAQQHWSDGQ
ncbi:MAG: phosphotransferase [Halioglobus sp.]|nr:phosphotransferase [Halioglobus sp.]